MPLLAKLAVVLATALFAVPASGEESLRLEEALFLLDDSDTPPDVDDPRWRRVRLPDRWPERRQGVGGFGWYRFEIPSPRTNAPRLALLLERVNMNAEGFVNGRPVGSGGSMREPVARNSNRPLYWVFPSALLDREVNTVDVRLFAYAHDLGTLGAVTLGRDDALRSRFWRQHFWQVELSQAATGLVLLTSIFFGVLWIGTGRERAYGWLAVSAACWTIVSLNYWLRDPAMSHWAWVRVFYAGLGGFAVTIPVWAHRLLDVRRPVLERIFFLALGVYGLLALLLSDAMFPHIVEPFRVVWLGVGAYGVWVLTRARQSLSRWEARVYATGGLACIALATSEVLMTFGAIGGPRMYAMPYIGLALVLCFATTLGVRFSSSLRDARHLNRELEDRVRAKTRELEANHLRLRELERGRVLLDERERIIREMHDGLGGQLVATLAMVQSGESESEEVAAALRDALDDMRSVIDSMDPLVDDLGRLFGTFRSRFEALLRRNDLRFVWNVGELPRTPWLGPEQYLHVLRILQEAVANAVKHGEPTELEVSVEALDPPEAGLRIRIRDDGSGPHATGPAGRGVAHMRARARELGGTLRIEPANPGTCVELWLPLTEALPPPTAEA